MILSDTTILEYLACGKIRIAPRVDARDVRPTGIRLHLGDDVMVPGSSQTIDLRAPIAPTFDRVPIGSAGFVLRPNAFVLGCTREQIHAIEPMVGLLDGRSTLARLGLLVHAGSTVIDGNHDEARCIVLELKNIGPYDLVLSPGLPIAMLVFATLSASIKQSSQAQYRGQRSVRAPNVMEDATIVGAPLVVRNRHRAAGHAQRR
jgi:dCTP deaminase